MKLREKIFQQLKQQFENTHEWNKMLPRFNEVCLNIPEIITNTEKKVVGEKIRELIFIAESCGFKGKQIEFLNEMGVALNELSQMKVFYDKDEMLDPVTIKKYANLCYNSEGIIGVDNTFNSEQLRKLTNGIFNELGQIKFFVSKELELEGKIIAEFYEHSQMLPVASLVESYRNDRQGEPYERKVKLFGENIDTRKYKIIKEVKISFYIYKFLTRERTEYLLMSTEKLEVGDYIVQGTNIESDDYKNVAESMKIKTKIQFLFTFNVQAKKVIYNTQIEFKESLKQLNVTEETMFDFPFTIENKKTKSLEILAYHDWYKRLIWAWLLHSKEGLQNEYPLHLMIIGPPSSAKSYLLNCLHRRSKEILPVFEGSGSTLKSLVPSFASKPAKVGYLGESSRFALCDEFLRCLPNVRNGTNRTGEVDESVGIMNALLEHQQRDMGSGNSRISVKMTARTLAVSNYLMGIKSMEDLCNKLDMSFVGRWLIYFQDEQDVELIRVARRNSLPKHEFNFSEEDYIGIIDFLQTQYTYYDKELVMEIYDEAKSILSDNLLDNYDARHDHHINCLMDGIIKTRCLFENNIEFIAKSEDYEHLRIIWSQIVKSWVAGKKIKNLPVEKRMRYIPSRIQYFYNKFSEQGMTLSRKDIVKLFELEFNSKEIVDNLIILIDIGLIFEEYGDYRPYWLGKGVKK